MHFTYRLCYTLGTARLVMEYLKVPDLRQLRDALERQTDLKLDPSCRFGVSPESAIVVVVASASSSRWSSSNGHDAYDEEDPIEVDEYDSVGVSLQELREAAKVPMEKLLKFFPLYEFEEGDYSLRAGVEGQL